LQHSKETFLFWVDKVRREIACGYNEKLSVCRWPGGHVACLNIGRTRRRAARFNWELAAAL
jgi:hypothetical protein